MLFTIDSGIYFGSLLRLKKSSEYGIQQYFYYYYRFEWRGASAQEIMTQRWRLWGILQNTRILFSWVSKERTEKTPFNSHDTTVGVRVPDWFLLFLPFWVLFNLFLFPTHYSFIQRTTLVQIKKALEKKTTICWNIGVSTIHLKLLGERKLNRKWAFGDWILYSFRLILRVLFEFFSRVVFTDFLTYRFSLVPIENCVNFLLKT